MIELFEHNRTAYESAVSMLIETGKAAIVHPTGTGKSFIGFKLCEDNPNKTVLWLSPSEYIFKTQLENLKETGAEVPNNIVYLTYARLMRMEKSEMSDLHPDIVLLDEMHRAGSPCWGASVQELLSIYPDVPVLGLTATAIRYLDDQRDMSEELFDGNVASEMTLGEAIVRGILNPPKYVLSVFSYQKDLEKYERRVRTARSKAVRDAAEKYLEALRRALEKADGLDVIFDKHMTDRTGKYIVFCANKEHMDEMMEKTGKWFAKVDKHPHVYSVYSDDPSASKSFADFKADEDSTHLRLLYCIDALNEGIHVENVSGVILLRPTVSPIIYKQQIGRALSASKSKEPVIFDIVMNIENLYSIDSVEEEMRVAMTYYRQFGNGSVIVNEQFRVIDELRDCRELFERLNDTLTASWDVMYGHAKKYYEAFGNLDVPRRYRTADGYSLGQWINTQRGVYRGTTEGVLGKDRIDKLNAIGMEWDSFFDRTWKQNYIAAEEYYKANGDLRVPEGYVTGTGLRLGCWIVNLRICRKNMIRSRYLTAERIADLDKIGMIWDVPDYLWERNYNAAMQYHRTHGNLNVPINYVTKDGIRLGTWIDRLRVDRRDGTLRLSEEQIQRLDELGMVWEKSFARRWETGYAAAREHFELNGKLDVPNSYKTETGFKLGEWISNQREKYRSRKMKQERIDRLNAIGMIWEKEDPWEVRFKLAEAYFHEHGSLNMSGNYTVDGICLSKWVNEQKQSYRGNRPKQKLTAEQIRRLESIGMVWRRSEQIWNAAYALAADYYRQHGNLHVSNAYKAGNGFGLGFWVYAQREKYRDGTLPEEYRQKLEQIGMDWLSPTEREWEDGYAAAERYFQKHGNLNVPENLRDGNFALGAWVRRQRESRDSLAVSGANGNQILRLNTIGMVWSDPTPQMKADDLPVGQSAVAV